MGYGLKRGVKMRNRISLIRAEAGWRAFPIRAARATPTNVPPRSLEASCVHVSATPAVQERVSEGRVGYDSRGSGPASHHKQDRCHAIT